MCATSPPSPQRGEEEDGSRSKENDHDRRIHLRRRPHAARQGPQGRLAARGHARAPRRHRAAGAARPQQPRHQAGRRRGAGLRHAGGRARRRHRPYRGGARRLRRDRAGRAGQPLLRLGPRGDQHGGGAGHVGPEPGHDRRRRREHEPRADGLGRRRLAGRSGGRDPDVLPAAGHLGRRDRHQVRHEP